MSICANPPCTQSARCLFLWKCGMKVDAERRAESEDTLDLHDGLAATYNPNCDEVDEVTIWRNGEPILVLARWQAELLGKFATERQERYS